MQAFRPGNVDLPINHAHTQNPAALTLPDVITELDLLPHISDVSLLLDPPSTSQVALGLGRARIGRDEDITLMDQSTQLLPDDIEQGLTAPDEPQGLEEDVLELDLDFGDELGGDAGNDTSIHMGREAPPARPLEDEFSDDMKMLDGDEPFLNQDADFQLRNFSASPRIGQEADELPLGSVENMELDLQEHPSPLLGGQVADNVLPKPGLPGRHERDSESPLPSIRPSEERELERDVHRHLDSTFLEPELQEESVHQPQRQRTRRLLQPDAETVLPSSYMKDLQQNRSSILKPTSFLPRDPLLLTLMNMQQNGGFVSSILGENRGKGWAPELRGILSLEVIRKSGKLKRKQNWKAGDGEEADERASMQPDKRPRLDLDQDELDGHLAGNEDIFAPNDTAATDGEVIDIPADDGQQFMGDDEAAFQRRSPDYETGGASPVLQDGFDDTIAPLVHPVDSGPVALGTKHAVHMLRERFGPAAAEDASQRQNSSVLFQELLPERSTTKADATKMFFEVLVLATKDAIKVDQEEGLLGGPIRVRGKRGLWGAWAEKEAGGEIAEQNIPDVSTPIAVEQ